jgi:hypothetical protein
MFAKVTPSAMSLKTLRSGTRRLRRGRIAQLHVFTKRITTRRSLQFLFHCAKGATKANSLLYSNRSRSPHEPASRNLSELKNRAMILHSSCGNLISSALLLAFGSGAPASGAGLLRFRPRFPLPAVASSFAARFARTSSMSS